MTLLHQVALTMVPGIGSVTARALVADLGGAENVFKAKRLKLMRSYGVGQKTADSILKHDTFARAEEELVFMEKNKIEVLVYGELNYPARLRHCYDAPLLLYFKGKADLNYARIVSVIGTRNATDYGKELTRRLTEELKEHSVLVVSGLAHGIDGHAHRGSLTHGVPTVAVLGHGLDRIYPLQHRNIAEKMLTNGGWLSEFPSQTIPDRENFPKRNRIIAGMSDATIVIEAGVKGGALITAELANSYDRDVLAFPGNVNSEFSVGCNNLIKTSKAHLVTGIQDIVYLLGWDESPAAKPSLQLSLLADLSEDEQKMVTLVKEKAPVAIDELTLAARFPQSKLSTTLLSLEMKGLIRSLPGKIYTLNT